MKKTKTQTWVKDRKSVEGLGDDWPRENGKMEYWNIGDFRNIGEPIVPKFQYCISTSPETV